MHNSLNKSRIVFTIFIIIGILGGQMGWLATPAVAISDPSVGNIDSVPSTTPGNLGELDLTKLQYGDPAEALALIQPPKASVDGGASLAHPLPLPPGRAGVQPDLALTYDSGGGSSWVGTGWDLSVGAVTVDTEFGAPRYLADKESETYQLDGNRLFPNAIRTVLEDRKPGNRADWVRQVADDNSLIIRHGNTPSSYCWEVADTLGNHSWYGGSPDANGNCVRDESAILTAPATGAPGGVDGDYYWALTYMIDISGNIVRYSYDELTGVAIGQKSEAPIGVSLYLKKITYTGFKTAALDKPAYQVRFLRDGDVTGKPPRLDVVVDASAGQPLVTRDLLRGVEVQYLSPEFYAGTAQPQVVKGWTLEYENGPFDKSLLTSVGQYGKDGRGHEFAWHKFTWYNEVIDPATGKYNGFGAPEQWGNRTNTTIPNIAAESALGTSWRAGGDGGAYIGFNPVIPSKTGSFGGSFNIAGGQTNEVSNLVDLNGDGLPDKVWVNSSGTVMYRPNLHMPGSVKTGDSWFGTAQAIQGIDSLGQSSDLKINIHFEAYPVVAIQVGGGFGFSFGDRYFADVNGDGRVDFIKPGNAGGHTVFYNVLDANGVPSFIDSSLAAQLVNRLAVPLDDFNSDLANAAAAGVADLLVNTSPRIDTVRRWLAPHTGTIKIDGTVSLLAGAAYRGDGAQVTIEHSGVQEWKAILDKNTPSSTHSLELAVTAGQAVWFRLHVIDNAADDEVAWDPTITYLDGPGGNPLSAALNANGLSQVVFHAAEDFTLFGRSGARTALSDPGPLTVNFAVDTVAGLSDNLDVVLLHGHGQNTPVKYPVLTVPQLYTGTITGTVGLTIAGPTTSPGPDGVAGNQDDIQETDWIEVYARSDSPVDPTKFSIAITSTAPGIQQPNTSGIPAAANFQVPKDIPIVPNVQVFARTDHTAPYVPVTSPDKDRMKEATIEVALNGPALDNGNTSISSQAVLTVKTLAGGVVARQAFTVEHVLDNLLVPHMQGSTTLSSFTPARNTTYYIEVSVANPTVGADVDLVKSTVTWKWTETEKDQNGNDVDVEKTQVVDNAGQLHWPDADGMFPSANRGWAYAGYNADHENAQQGGPLVESQFVFKAQTNGYDKNTPVPTASSAPSAGSVKSNVKASFDPSLPFIPWTGPSSSIADRWRPAEKETLNGKATTMQADRLGADTAVPGLITTGRQAPQMLSLDGDFHFLLGLVASFTAGAGGGRSLKDYEDYNGDGYPDIRNGSSIEYTGPRGAKALKNDNGDNPFDLGLAVGGGLNGSAVSVSSSAGASSPGNDSDANKVEPTTKQSSRGMKIGLGFSIGSQWTNPIANGEAYTAASGGGSNAPNVQSDQATDRGNINTAAGSTGTIVDRAYMDINGDGMPDRVDTYTSGELWVNLNLGYRFADKAIQWSTGRTSSSKNLNGSISVGFQFTAYEFAAGVAYSEGVNYSLFDWMDIDGDGVPDRMNNVADGQPLTVFGSGNGMLHTEIVYGTFPNGDVTVDAARFGNNGISLPPGQMDVSRSTGLSGGVDFSFYIGPICVVACYIVINPGVHAGYDRLTAQVQMVDMNGDGYLDAVRSTDPEHIEVRLNLRGRTNMLETVTNPLGGQIRLDYERTGNTTTNPESVWVMSSVKVDDGRAGDGPSVQQSKYTYKGNVFDPLLRDLMGFNYIREDQLDESGNVLRSYERDYLNGNPFETGTLVEERTLNENGKVMRADSFEWAFVNADPKGGANGAYGSVVTNLPAVGTTARTLLFDTALSPRLLTDRLTQWDNNGRDDPTAQSQTVATHYTYDAFGDVLTVHEENEHEVSADDTFTVITYSDCAPRDGSRTLTASQSWVSVPQTVTVYGNDAPTGERLKYRNGGPDLCVNSVPIRIAELVSEDDGNGFGPLYAITELSFDTYGSYNAVAWPSSAAPTSAADYPPETVLSSDVTFAGCSSLSTDDNKVRYCVDYEYDAPRYTAISKVTDNHGVEANATYDPFTGRLATRTDTSGNITTYAYDNQGRLASIVAPREQGTANKTMTYAYGGLDASFNPAGPKTWATASHYDRFNPGNKIDTATFIDGIGRIVQRKRDAEVEGVAGESRIVEGAIEYDALGREVKEWYPVVETNADFALTTYNTWSSETASATTHVPVTKPISRKFDIFDRLTEQVLPDQSKETIAYDFEVLPDPAHVYTAPITMSRTRTTDPLGKLTTRFLDVGGNLFLNIDSAAAPNNPDGSANPLAKLPSGSVIQAPRIKASTGTPGDITTAYEYDRLSRLTAVVDTFGARTEHTYNLQDLVTSTNTPDAGLVQRTFAPSGQVLTVTRAVGSVATYSYDRDRLMGVSYSDNTPAVVYEYGNDGAAENAAGRVTKVVDGSMERTYGYDADGNVSRETATKNADPFGTGPDLTPPTWKTLWEYDSLGRLAVLTYPDGEVLTHHYDLGGRPDHLQSQAPQSTLYDQYGNPVPRPDVTIVYVDKIRYDQFGEATFMRTGTGVETRYKWEPTRRYLAGINTDSTAMTQFDGSISVARPLQHLEYTYDAVGNVRDVLNRLYADSTDTSITQLGPPPVNNVPGPSQHDYTYDGHYRLTGGVGTYIDQKENRNYTYASDYVPNGNLLQKSQVTTTTSTTGGGGTCTGNSKKCTGNTTTTTTTDTTCESNTGSGGGSFNQDPENTYVIAAGDLGYATDLAGNTIHRLMRSGTRTYTYDDNGNMTGWVQPCAGGTSTISRTMTWDAENRLTRIAEGNNDTDMRYNAEGARTLERGPGGTTWFVNEHWRTVNDGHRYANIYVGEQLIASHRTSSPATAPAPCTDTLDSTCACQTNGACVVQDASMCNLTTQIFDPTTSTCQPKETRNLYFMHKDLQGSLRVATDEVGKVFQYIDYLPSGQPWVAGQNTIKDTPYLFAGGWTDNTYKLVNFGERWYDSHWESFLSPEPMLEDDPYAAVDDPSMLSAYTYAASNPLRYVDPNGSAPKLASTGFNLGDNYEKHQSGDISISVTRRANRESPKITFGGRYSNDAKGQKLSDAFKKHADRAERFSTILSISTEDGVRKTRLFGITTGKKQVGGQAAPNPGPGKTGAKQDDAPVAPPQPAGAPPKPAAQTAADQGTANAGGAASASTDTAATGAAAPPPKASTDSQSAPVKTSPPPPPPAKASAANPGPDDDK